LTCQFTRPYTTLFRSFSNPGVTASSLSVTDATHLTATVTIAASAALGLSGVTVTTGTETATGSNLFTVTAGTAVVTAIAPNSGQQGKGMTAVASNGTF